MWKYLTIVGQIGFTIAIPIVILALTGRYFDERLGTSPWFLISAVVLSLIISSIILYSRVLKTLQAMDEVGKNNQSKNKS